MRDNSELTLRKQKDFTKIYNRGKSQGSKFAVVIYRKNNLDYSRTAFVASKKVGNSVERNRSRRLLRESYRKLRPMIAAGYDIIFVARKNILEAGQQEVQSSLFGVLRSCGLIEKKGSNQQLNRGHNEK